MADHSLNASLPPDRVVTDLSDRRTAILDVIRGAKHSISLSLFRCNDEQVFEELARATSRGVAVRVLMTARAKGGGRKLEKLRDALQQTGAAVDTYADPVAKYHAKYLVADEGPAVVASLNFTRKCFDRTIDALVVTYDPAVVSGLRDLMDADREGRPSSPAISPRLIVGPDRARQRFTALITGARHSIRIIDAKLSDPDLVTLLNDRRRDGVTVDVFGAKRLGGFKSHGKILLVDSAMAVIGGLALSALSLDFRREVAITVEDPAGIAAVEQLFESVASTTLL